MTTLVALLLLSDIAEGGATPADKAKIDRIKIEEKLNAQVPMDAKFVDSSGNVVTLGSLFKKDRPVLLSIGYYSCPMLCDIVMNGIKTGVKGLDFDQYQVISISIEPTDTADIAKEKKKNYLAAIGKPVDWEMLTLVPGGEPHAMNTEAKKVADAVGWNYFWEESQNQFAHAAGVFVLTPEGKVSRVLYGIDYAPQDLKLAFVEAGQGKVGTAMDKILLWCYHYDPKGRTYVVYAIRVMRIGAAFSVFALIAIVLYLFRADKRRQLASSGSRS